MEYVVKFFEVNGISGCVDLDAKTVSGAKREATRLSCGHHNYMIIECEDGEPVAARHSKDSFRGCCTGWKKWITI